MITMMITVTRADATTAAAVMIGPGASACASGANVVKTAPPNAGGGDGVSANDGAA
jgi:hypothetical protein